MLSTLKDAETGQRGYLITGTPSYLAPYNRAIAQIHQRVQQLQTLTSDNQNQQQRLQTLQPLVDAKLAELNQTIQLQQSGRRAAAEQVVRSDRGKHTMDQIRALVAQMQQEEEVLLELRSQQSRNSIRQTTLALSLISVLTLLLLLSIYALITRDLTQRRRAEAALQRTAQRLAILHDIDRAILEAHSSIELAQSAVTRLCYLVPCSQAIVLRYNFEAGEAEVLGNSSVGGKGGSGSASPLAVGSRLPLASVLSNYESSSRSSLSPIQPRKELASSDSSQNLEPRDRALSTLQKTLESGEHYLKLRLKSESTLIGELR